MVSVASVEIIKELKESGEDYTNAILGTFSFEPDFFEDYILSLIHI